MRRSRGRIPHSSVISEEHMAKWINRRHPLSVIAFVAALGIHWCCGFDTPQDNGRPQLTDIVLSVAARGVHTECDSVRLPLTLLIHFTRGTLGGLSLGSGLCFWFQRRTKLSGFHALYSDVLYYTWTNGKFPNGVYLSAVNIHPHAAQAGRTGCFTKIMLHHV